MVESPPFCQRWPTCRTNRAMLDEAAFVAALTYLVTWPAAKTHHNGLKPGRLLPHQIPFGRDLPG